MRGWSAYDAFDVPKTLLAITATGGAFSRHIAAYAVISVGRRRAAIGFDPLKDFPRHPDIGR